MHPLQHKIGILTFHCANSYGAVWQAYALQQYLTSLGGCAEIIDYRAKRIIDTYKIFRSMRPRDLLKGLVKLYQHEVAHNQAFDAFRQKKLLLSPYSGASWPLPLDYQAVVVGSDQVWNPHIIGNDPAYFLEGTPGLRKIAYAASIGQNKLTQAQLQALAQKISSFDAVSLREYDKVNYNFEQYGLKDIEEVLDPTFLLSKQQWNQHLQLEQPTQRPYILLFKMTYNEKLNQLADQMAKKNHCEIKTIVAYNHPLKDRDLQVIRACSPEKFLSLIYNAQGVITDSFHGLAFSIIFEKNFFVTFHATRGIRLLTLLKKAGLTKRCFESQFPITNLLEPIDFTAVRKNLSSHIVHSKEYLKNSLRGLLTEENSHVQ